MAARNFLERVTGKRKLDCEKISMDEAVKLLDGKEISRVDRRGFDCFLEYLIVQNTGINAGQELARILVDYFNRDMLSIEHTTFANAKTCEEEHMVMYKLNDRDESYVSVKYVVPRSRFRPSEMKKK
tara:strand:- start:1685 stop:2065 length:381 start_codon:yes stop_codon:yes gene_type:complete